ncbi:UDP-N-acetylmuramate dehydrogenase [Vitreimonas flagellata]|uniref:UDP-N-acetylmuramate dehydrogenase n=1 Tax=Vitreimonas flagellata TaxID=2560861 RepID=UPI001074BC80|nr:UDP-N-acetylmuramate dehydrogenase [Vitreimonas flagellata]
MSELALPTVRGQILRGESLAPFTWFRVGGPAEALFIPADEDDLSEFLRALPQEIPVTVLGVGSNVIVRDGGVPGVVIRLAGRQWAQIVTDFDSVDAPEARVIAGAGALDSMVAKAAAKAGVAGLEFFAGIPGTIGGALTMNAGCYGAETKDVLEAAWGFDRSGEMRTFSVEDMGFTYRHSAFDGEIIWMQAVFKGRRDTPEAVQARMNEITARREGSQPIREKTGGSTFKNPELENGEKLSAWKLVDEAGMRGYKRGGAQVSEKHANFLINTGDATAADIEGLGEDVRAAVKAKHGVELNWEIKRIGRA